MLYAGVHIRVLIDSCNWLPSSSPIWVKTPRTEALLEALCVADGTRLHLTMSPNTHAQDTLSYRWVHNTRWILRRFRITEYLIAAEL
jgi:hypothetical protein